jgi:hypothetical protein
MGRKKVLEDELNDLEGKLQRAEKLVTGACLSLQRFIGSAQAVVFAADIHTELCHMHSMMLTHT